MAKQLKMLDGKYAAALKRYITVPLLETPGSSTQQKAGSPGAIMEDLRKKSA